MTAPKSKTPKSGIIMLALVAAGYLITFLLNPDAAFKALSAAGQTLGSIAPIIVAVFFLMALINTFFKPKSIGKHLGKKSGAKGWFIGLAGGILSHGPAYVWYPILSDIRSHGARNGLIIAFLYTRAIKLPWLPLMASYFGLAFTLLLCFYIIIGAWLQGIAADAILKEQ
jgi:uncharacterized membrane protein YraQ (UPF0718 family)